MTVLDDHQYWHNMMIAVFLDWFNVESGLVMQPGYTENHFVEAFDHYAWLTLRTVERDPVRGL